MAGSGPVASTRVPPPSPGSGRPGPGPVAPAQGSETADDRFAGRSRAATAVKPSPMSPDAWSLYASLFAQAVALGFAVAAPLGPTGAAVIRHGLAGGGFVALWIGLGAALTDLVYVLATYLGLAPLLLRLPWLTPVLYGLGALVLGKMGLHAVLEALRRAGPGTLGWAGDDADDGTGSRPAPRPALTGWRAPLLLGVTVTAVNPSTIASWLSVGGAFITAHLLGVPAGAAVGVMTGIMVGSAAWFTILAGLVGMARASSRNRPWVLRAVSLGAGLGLLGFAGAFAWRGVSFLALFLSRR